ncbi:MAG: Fic family protein [Pyrinomonadaceae bacterium]|nr:Fic family protein [Pyrinomonadaceae bacterium]
MKEKDFTESQTGRLVEIPEGPKGVKAFIPDPLPPKGLLPTWELSRLNSEADRALSELSGLARVLPNAHLLSGSFRRREAVLSSKIEGTVTTMNELFLFEAGGAANDADTDVREVHNYVHALNHGLERLDKLPVCNRLIKEIHRILMTGVRGGDKTPGEFRKVQNHIGPRKTTPIQDATYVPPPATEMLTCMNQLEEFINGRGELPPLVREALIHYQFEAIHPFVDGNGRVGRLLLTLNLCSEHIIDHPLLYLSEYIEKRKEEYYSLMFDVSASGAWQPWIEFFLRAVAEQARDAQQRAKDLHDLMQRLKDRLLGIKAPSYTLRVLEELFFIPVISSTHVTQLVGGQVKTGQRALEKLRSAGILRELDTGRQRNKLYASDEIHKLVTS